MNSIGRYICSQCDNDFTLKDGFRDKICVSSASYDENCLQYRDNGQVQECIKCDNLYSLLTISTNGNVNKRCLLTKTYVETGCEVYETAPSGELQCGKCDLLHALVPVRVSDTKTLEKCINIEDYVP